MLISPDQRRLKNCILYGTPYGTSMEVNRAYMVYSQNAAEPIGIDFSYVRVHAALLWLITFCQLWQKPGAIETTVNVFVIRNE